jgi:hypothetical protein
MAENQTLPIDPTGRRALLAAARADPRLKAGDADPGGFARAAYRWAVALGYCRLFDVPCGRYNGPPPGPAALAAVRALTDELERWARDAAGLVDEWLDAPGPDDADAVAERWVTRRTDALAAQVALAEAERAVRADDPAAGEELSAAIDAAEAGPLRRLDELLELPRHKEILGTVIDVPPASNLRALLAGPYRERPPWWLDPAALPTGGEWPGEKEPEDEFVGDPGFPTEPAGRVERYRRAEYQLVPPEFAGKFAGQEVNAPGREILWVNPDGTAKLVLPLPDLMTAEEWKRERPLNLRTLDGDPLGPETVRIGDKKPVPLNDEGQATVKLSELFDAPLYRVPSAWVGTPPVEWVPVSEISDDAHNPE